MAVIISLANQKGGAGKSVITGLLAKAFNHSYRKKVLILDADPQWTITELYDDLKNEWPDLKQRFDYRKSTLLNIEDKLKDNFDKYDYIFVDIPGLMHTHEGDKKHLETLFKLCDVILMPLKASKGVLKSSDQLWVMLKQLQAQKKELGYDMDVYAFLNFYKGVVEDKHLVENDFEALRNRGYNDIIPTHLTESIGLQRAFEYTPESVLESSLVSKKEKKQFQSFTKDAYSIVSQYE